MSKALEPTVSTRSKATTLEYSRPDGQSLPALDPSPNYFLAHHRARWVVMAGRVIPSLSRFPLQPGVNGVEVGREGRVQTSKLRTSLTDRGFVLIPQEKGPGGNYVDVVDTLPPNWSQTAKAHISAWETPYGGSSSTEVDEAAYAEWCEGLVKSGLIAPIEPFVARKMLDAATSALRDSEQRRAANKLSDHSRIDSLKGEIEVLKVAAQKRGAPVAKAKGSSAPEPEL